MDRALRQFLAIAEAGSMTAAAHVLNVMQPTLTVNMQKLEQEIGLPLLRRTPKARLKPQFASSTIGHWVRSTRAFSSSWE
jgi:DNA-binding transcriptional LysR family regulator